MRNSLRIIFVSPNQLLHNQWDKAIDLNKEVTNIYREEQIIEFDFSEEDIVLFDFDNLGEFLDDVLKSKVICLSSQLDELKGYKLLKEGIKGYGNSYMTPFNLKGAISVIKSGKLWIYPELMNFIIEHSTMPNLDKKSKKIELLSSRELDVAKLVSKGLTNKAIAFKLDITERTVKAHISSAFNRLELKDRVSLGILVKEYLT